MGLLDALGLRRPGGGAPEDASSFGPGGRHYRAWVGPPEVYDYMGGLQFSLLFHAALRENHKLCDLGCGSLRAGRLFVPYLLPGNYYGIEPDRGMLQAGIDNEIGRDLVKLKRPTFLHGRDFPLEEFGVEFDFVLAQSIWSHTYPGLMRHGMTKVAASLSETGTMVGTYWEADPATRAEGRGWRYPGLVPYAWHQVERILGEAGLVGRTLDWPHRRQVWFVAARPDQETRLHALAGGIRSPVIRR